MKVQLVFVVAFQDQEVFVVEHQVRSFIELREHMQRLFEFQRLSSCGGVPGSGDNLFLASIVAVKADTGEYVWHYQVCPGEQWDCTANHTTRSHTAPHSAAARRGRWGRSP